jgi:hypothetical protein
VAGLLPGALARKRIAVVTSTVVPYLDAITTLTGAGASTTLTTIGTPLPNPPSSVSRELKRDLYACLVTTPQPAAAQDRCKPSSTTTSPIQLKD